MVLVISRVYCSFIDTGYCFLVPDNDDVMFHIRKLREKLGWKTEIPRHAPGCKEAMEVLKDIPDNEKVNEFFSLFSYSLINFQI